MDSTVRDHHQLPLHPESLSVPGSRECSFLSRMYSLLPHGVHTSSSSYSVKYSVAIVVQSLGHMWLLWPWTAAHQASLSFTVSQSLLKLKSIESTVPSKHLILCHPLLLLPSIFPSIRVFPSSHFFASCGQIIAGSASASVLPMNSLRVDFL